MTDPEPPDDERVEAEPQPGETASNLDATLEGLPDDPAPPMPHLRPIRDLLADERQAEQSPDERITPRRPDPPLSPDDLPPPPPIHPPDDDLPGPSEPPEGRATRALEEGSAERGLDGPAGAEDSTLETADAATGSPGEEEAPEVSSVDRTAGQPDLPPAEIEPAAPTSSVAVAVEEQQPEEAELQPEAPPATPPAPRRAPALPISAHLVVLVGLATAVFLAFSLIEPTPRWLLLVGAGAVMFGLDGVLRTTWREPFASGETTAPYLFLPALYMLGAPIIVEHNIPAPAVILAALGIGLGFGAVAVAELISVRPGAPEYPYARLVATTGAYFTLFALASMTYVFDASLTWALVATGMLGLMLGIEVLREGEIDPIETLVFSLIVAFVLIQTRWVLHYLPLDSYMAGLTLTLVFFFTTGLLHAHITRQFGAGVVVEYTGIAAAGFALVVVARSTGLA